MEYLFDRILIIQTAFIGDVILATPIVEKLKKFYPGASIDFLLRKGNESLLDNNPNLNEVIIFNKKEKKYQNLIRLIKYIRGKKYDLVINIQRYATTGIITVFSRAKLTVGFKENPLSFLFSRKIINGIDTRKQSPHEVERNIKLIEEFTDSSFEMPRLYPSAKDKKKIDTPEKYYCIAPNSVLYTKEYPIDKWVELIKKLPADATVYLLGAPNEKEKSNKIMKQCNCKNVVNLTGSLTFLESAALMQGAKMNFMNDSAPLHIASAVNAPARAIFLSTSPVLGYGPLSDDSLVIETKRKLSCRPCGRTGKKKCPEGHFLCSDIPVQDILETL